MVGLILPIMKIPTLRQGSHSRCGRLSKLRNFSRALSFLPHRHVIGTGTSSRSPSFPPKHGEQNRRAPLVSWRTLVRPGFREIAPGHSLGRTGGFIRRSADLSSHPIAQIVLVVVLRSRPFPSGTSETPAACFLPFLQSAPIRNRPRGTRRIRIEEG